MNEYCKICGTETREFVYEKLNMKYYYCDYCEFISRDENSIISKEEELKRYQDHNNSIEDIHYVNYFKRFIDNAIVNYCSEGKSGFDFGSGPSPVLSMILERDYGFDMDIYDLYFFNDKGYENKKYDLVTSTEVVEHLKNPLEYFIEFKNLLKEDGLLSIMTMFHPNEDDKFLNWNYMRDLSHISFYTLKTMDVIAQKVGLEIIYTDKKRCTSFKLKANTL